MTTIVDGMLIVSKKIDARIVNNSDAQIDKGCPVCVSGANGSGLPAVVYAQANDAATAVVLGVAAENIGPRATGKTVVFGLVRDVDTSGFSVNDTLYLDADNAGGLVNVVPDSPGFTVIIGTVLTADANAGVILIDITQASIIAGTIQSAIYNLPLRGVLGAELNITGGVLRSQAASLTGDYTTDFAVDNNHVYLLVNSITGMGGVTITGTSVDETDGTPIVDDIEVIEVDDTVAQYWQSFKKWWDVISIDIPDEISAINYDLGVVGYPDFGNTDFKIIGYRIDAPSKGVNSQMRFRIIKINDDGAGKMHLSDIEDIEIDASSGTDQVVDYLRTGDDDRTHDPTVASLWSDGTVVVLKQGDLDTYFTSDENVFESSTKDEGFILRIEDANNVEFVTLRLDYQLLG